MSDARVVTEELGGGALTRAALAGEVPEAWYCRRPRGADEWRARVQQVVASVGGDWLTRLTPAMEPVGAAAERLRRVIASGGGVVTTGQQPGLFGGPLMTFFKALTARALADAIERTTGIPMAPVFWAATDDSDLAEGSWVKVALTGGAVELRVHPSVAEGTPMSAAPLGGVEPLLAQLADACGSGADGPVMQSLRRAYHDGATMGGAYLAFLRELLQPLGIAVIDATHPATRAAGEPLLRRALERGEAVQQALLDRTASVAAAGFAPQVEVVSGLSLVFTNEHGIRRRLPIVEALTRGRELAPGSLSPNVLLRPVMERAILPTVAYVGGPGELAYFAQLSAVADALDAEVPLGVPRWSGTILDSRLERVLARIGVTDHHELAHPEHVETRLARAAVPPELRGSIEAMRDRVASGLAGVGANDVVELVPRAVLEGLARRVGHQIDRLERRYAAAIKRRETQMMLDVATARGGLFPDGTRQERALAYAPFVARHGDALVDAILAAAGEHADRLIGAAEPSLGPPRQAARR